MAALLHDRPDSPLAAEPVVRFLGLAPDPAPAPPGPALRVIPGGREAALRRRLPEHVYRARRRRVAVGAAVVLLTLVLALSWALADRAGRTGEAVDGAGDGPATPAPAAVAAGAGGLPTSYVVQPGDTLWGIAAALEPDGDIRPVVDALADRAGPGPLEAGERLDLTGLTG